MRELFSLPAQRVTGPPAQVPVTEIQELGADLGREQGKRAALEQRLNMLESAFRGPPAQVLDTEIQVLRADLDREQGKRAALEQRLNMLESAFREEQAKKKHGRCTCS